MSGSPHHGIVRHHEEPQIVLDDIREPRGFDWAITRLKMGNRVARRGWNGKGMWLTMFTDNWSGAMVRPLDLPADWQGMSPFIAMYTADKKLVPWLASQTDLLADDWEWA